MKPLLARLRGQDFNVGTPPFYAAALLVMYLAYLPILALTFGLAPLALLLTAAANVAPVALLGLPVRQMLKRFVLGRAAVAQIAAHCALSLLFTILWFWLLMVLLGAASGLNAVQFSVRPFLGPAAAWQLFQGLFVYALIAVAVHAEALAERARRVAAEAAAPAPQRPRLFIKQEDELRPLDIDSIILIRGADDYSEVVTGKANHLVRMTLTVLAAKLGDGFIRVHRSCLVNLDRIARVEPAGGGRMLVHMESGEMVQSSRAGAKLLRDRVI
jgi:hypothetical protein